MRAGRLACCAVVVAAALPATASAAGRTDVVAQALAGVATVSTGTSVGTAFAVDDGIVLTNAHVVGGATSVEVRDADGRSADARVVAIDRERDVARLETSLALKPLPQAPAAARTGQDVLIIGAPDGLSGTVTRGIVSATGRMVNGVRMIQSDAAANPGNSGGPMLDGLGRVLGVTTAKQSEAEGIAFAIPIGVALDAVGTANEPRGASRPGDQVGSGGLSPAWLALMAGAVALLGFGVALLVRRRRPSHPVPQQPPASVSATSFDGPDEDPVVIVHRDPVVVRRRAGTNSQN